MSALGRHERGLDAPLDEPEDRSSSEPIAIGTSASAEAKPCEPAVTPP